MSQTQTSENKNKLKAKLLERLHNPVQLRVFVTGLVLLIGYGGIYLPLQSGIDETTRKLNQEQKRLDLARELEHLRAQLDSFKDRLPEKTDPNEWVQYVLGGIRSFPLKMITLDCEPPRSLGPYKAVVLRIELEGKFHDIDAFLRWLESNERLFRADTVKIAPSRGNKEMLVMQLTVLGATG